MKYNRLVHPSKIFVWGAYKRLVGVFYDDLLWNNVRHSSFFLDNLPIVSKVSTTSLGWIIWRIRRPNGGRLSKKRGLVAYVCSGVYFRTTFQGWVLELGQVYAPPNEDLGRPTKHSGTYFQSTFQRNVAQIECSPLWKVLWKYVPECSLGRRPSKIFVWRA